jgi:hypothetical protein
VFACRDCPPCAYIVLDQATQVESWGELYGDTGVIWGALFGFPLFNRRDLDLDLDGMEWNGMGGGMRKTQVVEATVQGRVGVLLYRWVMDWTRRLERAGRGVFLDTGIFTIKFLSSCHWFAEGFMADVTRSHQLFTGPAAPEAHGIDAVVSPCIHRDFTIRMVPSTDCHSLERLGECF